MELDEDSKAKLKNSWCDSAVHLLLDLYRVKESEMQSKQHTRVWNEIAEEMQVCNDEFRFTGQQCSVKMAGLRRTYKNIKETFNIRGSIKSNWPFYTAMEAIFEEDKWVGEASTAGPKQPKLLTDSPSKRKHVDAMLADLLTEVRSQRQERRQRDEIKRKRDEERTKAREERHAERMQVNAELLNLLRCIVDK